MVPFWPHTEPGPALNPVSEHLEATLVQRMLFIALMAVAQVFTQRLFAVRVASQQRTSKRYIVTYDTCTNSFYNT
jgi:hypothetical protein